MLTTISWMDYSLVIVSLGSLYYLFVGFRYYPTELKELLSGRRKRSLMDSRFEKDQEPEDMTHQKEQQGSLINPTEERFQQVELLVTALKDTIQMASEKQYRTEELSNALTGVLKDYPQLQGAAIRTIINQLIFLECQKYETIKLCEDEVMRL